MSLDSRNNTAVSRRISLFGVHSIARTILRLPIVAYASLRVYCVRLQDGAPSVRIRSSQLTFWQWKYAFIICIHWKRKTTAMPASRANTDREKECRNCNSAQYVTSIIHEAEGMLAKCECILLIPISSSCKAHIAFSFAPSHIHPLNNYLYINCCYIIIQFVKLNFLSCMRAHGLLLSLFLSPTSLRGIGLRI